MKKVSLLLVLVASFAFLFSCHKEEGGVIPSIENKITGYTLDTTGVLQLKTSSDFDMVVDMVKLYYVEDTEQTHIFRIDADSIAFKNVLVPKGGGIVDTIWGLKPNTAYKYYAVFEDFTPLVDTIADTLLNWKSVKTMNPGIPERVKADTAWINNDTLWLFGTVRSHWRPLMDSIGLTRDLKFEWGTEEAALDNNVVAQKVLDTIAGGKMEITIGGCIPKRVLTGAAKVWYRAYAKHAWGDGEQSSEIKSISLSAK